MKKIYLFCAAGMSTSMLASAMQDAANKQKLEVTVKAFPEGKIGQIIEADRPDVILLGPQVRYMLKDVVSRYGNEGIPIDVINQLDYGMMDGKKVLAFAMKLLK